MFEDEVRLLWLNPLLKYQEEDDKILVFTYNPGKVIGKKGAIVKAIQKHLGKKVKVISR